MCWIKCLLTPLAFFLVFTLCENKFVWKKCPNKKCMCYTKDLNETYMNCSGLNIKVVPPPGNVTEYTLYLTLHNNTISELSPLTFSQLANNSLVSILLFSNKIYGIRNDTFSALSELNNVVFSDNRASYGALSNAVKSLRNVPVKTFTISSTNITCFNKTFFNPLANHRGLNISLVRNKLQHYQPELFAPLLGLNYLNLRGNKIKSMNVSQSPVQKVTRLRLDENLLDDMPIFCNNNVSSFPNLRKLELKFNHITFLYPKHYECLSTLEDLHLDGNLFSFLQKGQFTNLASLTTLGLSYIGCTLQKVEEAAFTSKTLKNIFFRKNGVQFGRIAKNEKTLKIFHGCPSLELLNINFNVLTFLKEDDYDEAFRNMTTLKSLTIGGCGLRFIPRAISKYLKKLRELDLYSNEIKEVDLRNVTSLEQLRIARNTITTIKENGLPSSLFNTTGRVDLSNNPLSCGCESLWLLQTIEQNRNVFKVWKNNGRDYVCDTPKEVFNKSVLDVHLSVQKCLLNWNARMIIVCGSSIIIFAIAVTSVLYYFRWHLMYFWFLLRNQQRQIPDFRNFEYDAFVAYNVADVCFVKEHLIKKLEGEEKLKLCIHNRDFEVGKAIVDNIVDSIEKSRKVIVVLSNSFAQSNWCQFELSLIQHHVIENNGRLVVAVVLEPLKRANLTKGMVALLQTTTYLEWGSDPEAKRYFFNHLRLILKPPSRKRRRLSL